MKLAEFVKPVTAICLLMPAGLLLAQAPAQSPIHLKVGHYVQEDTACMGAPNAALREWDGNTFLDARATQCTTRVLKQTGKSFTVENVCAAGGDGTPGQGSKEKMTLQVLDDHTFRLVLPGVSANDKSTVFRLCASIDPR